MNGESLNVDTQTSLKDSAIQINYDIIPEQTIDATQWLKFNYAPMFY